MLRIASENPVRGRYSGPRIHLNANFLITDDPNRATPTLAFTALSSHPQALSGITHILGRLEQGDAKAAEELLPLVYEELRGLAAGRMANKIAGQTLQPTALVHEAWLRLGGDEAPSFQNRAHFFGAAAEAMRRILIERARRRLAATRRADSPSGICGK